MKAMCACWSGLLLIAASGFVHGLEVSLPKVQKAGDRLRVEIDASGDVGVDNGLRKTSEIAQGSGRRVFDLGKVNEPGFYRFTFTHGILVRELIVPVLSAEGWFNKPIPQTTEEEQAISKLMSLHTMARLQAAWKSWPLGEEMAKRVVKVTTVGTLAIFCPVEGVACVPAATEAVDLGLDLAIAFEEHFASECLRNKLITAGENAAIKRALKAARLAKSVATVRGKWDAAIAGVELFTAAVDNQQAELAIGLFTDQANKTQRLMLLIKRP